MRMLKRVDELQIEKILYVLFATLVMVIRKTN
jgi:hypothetical protein